MSDAVSGHAMLQSIERLLEETRREVARVDAALEQSSAELARLRQAELGVLSVLARIRLREIESGALVEALDDTGRQVAAILAERGGALAKVEAGIAAAEVALAQIQRERNVQSDAVDAAAQALDHAEAQAQQHLQQDAAYRKLLEQAQASDEIARLAEMKARAAHTDRAEKGKPYEADPLFAYLWARAYGTSRYRAGALTRALDRWVARVANYEPLRRDYWMLSELPARVDEHAARMRAQAETDVAAVQMREVEAAEAAGVPEREHVLEDAQAALAVIDGSIEAQEAAIAELVEERARFASGEDERSRRCAQILGAALRGEKMRTLREHANRTPTRDDDKAVDELTVIRAETPRLEDEVARYKSLHQNQLARTAKLEEVRRRFKEHHYDNASSEFVNGALVATLLTQLLHGSLGVADIWDAIRKQQRFRQREADPRFGSGGLPGAPGPWHRPGGFPKGNGGFRKGGSPRNRPPSGGFGGGGFRTGGGFGKGGGFKTGGGF